MSTGNVHLNGKAQLAGLRWKRLIYKQKMEKRLSIPTNIYLNSRFNCNIASQQNRHILSEAR